PPVPSRLSPLGISCGDYPVPRSALHPELLGIPFQTELARRRHVADERRRCDDGRARQVPFAAQPHAVLPVAVERRDRALALLQCVGSLAETRTAPRLPNLPANRSEDLGYRLAGQPRVRPFDLAADTARPWKDDQLPRRVRG